MSIKKWIQMTLLAGACLTLAGTAFASSDGPKAQDYAKPGFYTAIEDGRLWVIAETSKELEEFKAKGELAKHVVRPLAGPGGITIKAPDADTITLYLSSKPGYHVALEDGRLWVLKLGSKELEEFQAKGELAKHVVRPLAGPGGITLKAPDAETLDSYLSAQ